MVVGYGPYPSSVEVDCVLYSLGGIVGLREEYLATGHSYSGLGNPTRWCRRGCRARGSNLESYPCVCDCPISLTLSLIFVQASFIHCIHILYIACVALHLLYCNTFLYAWLDCVCTLLGLLVCVC